MGGLFSHQEDESLRVFKVHETGKRIDSYEEIKSVYTELLEHKDIVTEITLSQNSYGVEACNAISEAIQQCVNLQVANLSDLFVGRQREEVTVSMRALGTALLNCKSLEVLDVSDNAFGPDGVRAFSELLEKAASLKELHVNNDGLGPESAAIIAESLRRCENLKLEVFSAGRDRLENPGISVLAEAFSAMGSLRKISVPQNGIKAAGMVALFGALSNNPNMQVIEINDNNLKDEAAYTALAQCLESLNYISVLNIGDCLLGDAGARKIITALKSSNPHLRQLYLNYDELENPAIIDELVELLQMRPELELVEIKGNEFPSKAKKRLADFDFEREVSIALKSEGEEEEEEEEEEKEEEELAKGVENIELKED
ncbi:unnamed protein product [Blepharisma stoltei]|uniref:Uncharacterized protein n=1 Tax=Blepharisma stoltei TaxID=1481888 RepID=A0AAU9JZQ0_9CILI|nr:unnamed protein product [Blepharisma stoltei]